MPSPPVDAPSPAEHDREAARSWLEAAGLWPIVCEGDARPFPSAELVRQLVELRVAADILPQSQRRHELARLWPQLSDHRRGRPPCAGVRFLD